MKIGIVSSYFYPWYGGITEHVYYQYKELKKRGHDVKLITPFDGKDMIEQVDDLIKLGTPVPLILNGSVVKIPLLARKKEQIINILNQQNFDILHLHQPLFCLLGLTFLTCIRKRKESGLQCPVIFGTFHASGGGTERFIVKMLSPLYKRYRGLFDWRIAVSSASRDFVKPIHPGSYEIIPNGVDVNRFDNTKKIERYDDGVMNILFVGRLEPRKGLTKLLKSIPFIQKQTSLPFRLLVVGNGVLTQYYKKRVPKEVQKLVDFIGEVSFEDLPKYYKTAHIFCSPATYGESFGIVLIEAMASGLPIVAGNNEGYRKVITNNKNGVLVNPQNPSELASTISYLLNSEAGRKRLAKQSFIDAKKYSWEVIVQTIEQKYYEFLRDRNNYRMVI